MRLFLHFVKLRNCCNTFTATSFFSHETALQCHILQPIYSIPLTKSSIYSCPDIPVLALEIYMYIFSKPNEILCSYTCACPSPTSTLASSLRCWCEWVLRGVLHRVSATLFVQLQLLLIVQNLVAVHGTNCWRYSDCGPLKDARDQVRAGGELRRLGDQLASVDQLTRRLNEQETKSPIDQETKWQGHLMR